MRKCWTAILAMCVMAIGTCFALGGDKASLCKVYDHMGEEECRVLGAEELKTLTSEIRNESRFHARALANAGRTWKADEELKKKPFPRSAAKVRRITVVRTYNDRQEADDGLAKYLTRASEKKAEDAKRRRAMGKTDSGSGDKKAAYEQRREETRRRALEIYEAELAKLVSPGADTAE